MDANIFKYMAFVKTVEYGSFTKAAEILHYSQSGVSRMINDLEKEWKVSLLERSRAGVRLTSDGHKLLPYAQRVCEEYDKLQIQVDELNGLQSGLIRIGTISSVATHWLPNIMKAFQKDYPNIDFELLIGDYSEIESWIADGRVDFGFVKLPTRPNFETIFMERDKLLVILPKGHPLETCEVFPTEALCNDPFILLEKGTNVEVSAIFEESGIKPNVRFTTWEDYAIMSMVESGLGISILPQLILRRKPYDLVEKELDKPAYRTIAIAFRDKKAASKAVQKFMEYMQYR